MNAVPDKTEMIEEQDKRIDEVLNSIKKRIVIFSGKGGVGKTTAAAAGVCFTETYGPVRGHFVGVHYSTLPGTSEWISSTGLIKVSGAVTGIVYMSSVTSIGSGGSWFRED